MGWNDAFERKSSKYRGVYWADGKWFARVTTLSNGMMYLGRFKKEKEAAQAATAAYEKHGYPNRSGANRKVTAKSGYRGVYRHRDEGGTWRVMICMDMKLIYVGSYKCPKEAALMYDKMALKYLGEKAILNFPSERNLVEEKP